MAGFDVSKTTQTERIFAEKRKKSPCVGVVISFVPRTNCPLPMKGWMNNK
jgi:hypothetical protein